jgi:DNA-binding transcriptional LysR family regulator
MFEYLFAEGGLSLDRLKVLVEVQDAGSIAQATPGNSVRHSQHSRQLRELAEFFGCEVAQRKGKVLKLTDEGARLAQLARNFFTELQDLRAECRRDKISFSIGAGDSLVQWLVIPRLGQLLRKQPNAQFGAANLRTREVVNQVVDSRLDFGLVRKNAVVSGLKSAPLGTLTYVAVVPTALITSKATPTLGHFFSDYPMAMQTTDGEFTSRLREIIVSEKAPLRPALACQTFPQVFAAVRSGNFAAILPEIAARELPSGLFRMIRGSALRMLQRDIVLIWNARVIRVRPTAAETLTQIQSVFRLG